jgi:hypothetical protein
VEEMIDPAWGRTRAERALGVSQPKNSQKKKRSRVNEFRNIHIGQFDGPKPSYGRYNVSEQSKDILDRSRRNMDMR